MSSCVSWPVEVIEPRIHHWQSSVTSRLTCVFCCAYLVYVMCYQVYVIYLRYVSHMLPCVYHLYVIHLYIYVMCLPCVCHVFTMPLFCAYLTMSLGVLPVKCPPRDKRHCGQPQPYGFPKTLCKDYSNVRQDCPFMCGICKGAQAPSKYKRYSNDFRAFYRKGREPQLKIAVRSIRH